METDASPAGTLVRELDSTSDLPGVTWPKGCAGHNKAAVASQKLAIHEVPVDICWR